MKKTLQDQYLLIKEGKGHKGVFLADAKRQFPNIVRNAATFEEASSCLKTKNIISENVIGLTAVNSPFEPKKKESYELAFENFLAEAKKKQEEDEKAELKATSKQVEEDLSHNFDRKDDKNPDNLIFDQIMTGYYTEMKDPKNVDKTMQELKDMVFKNLQKDPIFYTKEGQFGVKGLGYSVDHPGLGEPKEPKGKYKASGYGDLNEGIIKEELKRSNSGAEYIEINGKTVRTYTQNGDKSFNVVYDDGTKDTIMVSHNGWDDINGLHTNEMGLDESKLRKVIRETIDAELEEMRHLGNLNTANTSGGGGKRFIPSELPFPQNIRKRFGEHIVYNPGSETLYISDILYNNLVKGYANSIEIKKLIMDIPPMVKQVLNKPENYGPPTSNLPKEFDLYHPLNSKVEKAKADKFNKAGDKQYWSEGDFLIPNMNTMKENSIESLQESVEKELAAINKEAEHEIIASKLEKVQTLIDKKQAQISRLDEDEDLKDLTDAKKVKEILKDIKSLEKAKAKLEKMMHKGKAKSPRKEVIDETDETIDEVDTKPTEEYSVAREEARDEYNTSKGSIKKTQFKYPEFAEMLKSDIIGNEEGMDF